MLRTLFCSGVSQRRAARILDIHLNTVARKLRFLAELAALKQNKHLKSYERNKINFIQFDEMETFEHTKLKPISIALAVEPKTRQMLGFKVACMPAKGHLAELSRRKYGPREDHRSQAMSELLKNLSLMAHREAVFLSDENPKYPRWLRNVSQNWLHKTVKGRRGCIVGQGELKKIGFDPLFSLNHTCAMVRANVNRLFRRTWCTTKKIECLANHLWVYMDYHNRELTRAST
jgi:hypothetical protein